MLEIVLVTGAIIVGIAVGIVLSWKALEYIVGESLWK